MREAFLGTAILMVSLLQKGTSFGMKVLMGAISAPLLSNGRMNIRSAPLSVPSLRMYADASSDSPETGIRSLLITVTPFLIFPSVGESLMEYDPVRATAKSGNGGVFIAGVTSKF